MTEIYITRHGETDWNAQQIFRGLADIDLNAAGIKQAELLAGYLKDVQFEAIYCSPLERAQRTARIIAGQHYRLQVDPAMDLIDLDFGEWQGVSAEDVKEKDPETYKRWQKEPQRVRIPGGESIIDVKKRVQKFLDNTVNKHEGAILLVSHRIVAKVLILQMLGMDVSHFQNIKMDPCGVTVFSYENDRFVLVRHNDICFLKSLQKAPIDDF